MEPYERASQTLRQGKDQPINLLKNIGMTAAGAGAAHLGAKALAKITPAVGALISKYVPDNLSMAGLNKINPGFGKFIQGALDAGHTYDEIRGFISEKVEKSQNQINSNKKNIIEQHSPELHQFIEQEIQKGRSPLQAGALAVQEQKGGKGFRSVIEKLVKQHKTDWPSILEAVYGASNAQKENAPQQSPAQSPQAPQANQAQVTQGGMAQEDQALLTGINNLMQKL